MRNLNICIFSLLMIFSAVCFAQEPADSSAPALQSRPAASNPQPPQTFDQVLDRVVEREHFFMAQMRQLHPLVETYIQDLKNDPADPSPVKDHYFLGRLDMTDGPQDITFMGEPKLKERLISKFTNLYSMKFLPQGFAQMIVMDGNFQRKFYDFTFVRREFLGEIRCLVIDVHPKEKVKDKDHSSQGRFVGRIWVEDENFNVVRFNGTYSSKQQDNFYLHFDSWRLNMRPGVWLPAYVYSEESDLKYRGSQKLHYKAQTRLWGYDLHHLERNEEFTQIVVDSPQNVNDKSEAIQDATPVESERRWQREAEDNAVDRLLNIGLLAPVGDVDKVLQTVVNNLIVTNNLEIQPEVRTRVLLTSPLESFTIGHTIVISRGMLDVLPDEASLAMVLAHELSHIALDHRLDTKFAFNDRMFFPDQNTFERLDFARPFTDEEAADKRALELLTNSPYKDKLGSAGLFLKALQLRAPVLKNLIRPHLGNSLANGPSTRMSALLNAAPNLEAKRTDQIAALPLGGRIKLDPWSDRVELVKTKAVALVFPTEKMPFEVTPFFPYLTRMPVNDKVAASAPSQ